MAPHQERVVNEKSDLDEKIGKLTVLQCFRASPIQTLCWHAFIAGPIFAKLLIGEKSRLERQLGAMTIYSNILAERIAAFDQE